MNIPLLTIKLAKPGVELVLNALAQLPYSQSAGLIRAIEAQANMQLDMMKRAAETAQKQADEAPTETTTETTGD